MSDRRKSAPAATSRPITDAFGIRLEPSDLLAGVAARLDVFRLALDDEGAALELRAEDLAGQEVEHAHAWLKDRLAGWSVRLSEGKFGPGFKAGLVDLRRVPVLTVSMVELDIDASSLAAAKRTLAKRLGSGAKEPFFLEWKRLENLSGFKPAHFVAASLEKRALDWLESQVKGSSVAPPSDFRVLLDGLECGLLRRPTIARESRSGEAVVPDAARCSGCGTCAKVCPVGRLAPGGKARPGRAEDCLRCFGCVESCPRDALRPGYSFTSAMRAEAACRQGWLSRLKGLSGPCQPAPFPPSYLLPKPGPAKKPAVILGLAINTMQEHAACLIKDGRLVGAVEEEKLSRVRHHGWPPAGARRYGFAIEESFCRRAIRLLLTQAGLTLDDVDLIAVNGLPPRYGLAVAGACGRKAPESLPIIRSGRLMFIPHHLCHAASAFRLSGQKEAWVLTADGRGERQTAAVFRARKGVIEQVYELRSLSRRSIGGVYESVTRLLGFGTHGQGIVMALAAMGKPKVAFGRWLSWKGPEEMSINEDLGQDLAAFSRTEEGPLKPAHLELAASLQAALEDAILAVLDRFVPARPEGLCLAGGVALNCRMNQVIRERLKPKAMFVQPGANDAGTALGAALEALALTDPKAKPMILEHAGLGPEFPEAELEAALAGSGLAYHRSKDQAKEAAALLAQGKVAGWFQGRLEFGPRALGGRSILADPRSAGMKDKVNGLKERHAFRPFGPSVIAGREGDWFEDPQDSRFMLFTVPVKRAQASRIPAVLHVDGTTRPQSVHPDTDPVFHRLLSEFERLTKVPMVLNTSFNRKGEPIVATPQEALSAFTDMGLDFLVMGPFVVERKPCKPRAKGGKTYGKASGRRLSLRLTVDCDLACPHCTIRDLKGLKPRPFRSAVEALEKGREAGCDELVYMRGEPGLWPRLAELSAKARAMGYRFIQVQTHARLFGRPELRAGLLEAVDAAEVVLLSADEACHDELSGVRGSFREALMGIKVLLNAGKSVLVTVPVLARNLERLSSVPVLLAKLNVTRVQFNFPRPVQLPRDAVFEPLVRLSDASRAVAEAARLAQGSGLAVSTEGLPLCLLPERLRSGAETAKTWDRFRADDLNGVHETLGEQIARRPEPPACRSCSLTERCPKTWPLYLEAFGSGELKTVKAHG
ncbi:MAG: radical SAM protein [Elusimicrobia bacterium]|nr:radical SAM protein [Elusimicrobiota bacterium]